MVIQVSVSKNMGPDFWIQGNKYLEIICYYHDRLLYQAFQIHFSGK